MSFNKVVFTGIGAYLGAVLWACKDKIKFKQDKGKNNGYRGDL